MNKYFQSTCIVIALLFSMLIGGCAKVTSVKRSDLTSANKIDRYADIDKYFIDQDGKKTDSALIVRFSMDRNGKININKIYFNQDPPTDREVESTRLHNGEISNTNEDFVDYIELKQGKNHSAYKPEIGMNNHDYISVFYSEDIINPVDGLFMTALSPLGLLLGEVPQYSRHKVNNNITMAIGDIITTRLHSEMKQVENYASSYHSFSSYDIFKLYCTIRNNSPLETIEDLRPQIIAQMDDLQVFKKFQKDSVYGADEQTVKNNMLIDVSCFDILPLDRSVVDDKTGKVLTLHSKSRSLVLNFSSRVRIRDYKKIKSYPIHLTVRYTYVVNSEVTASVFGIAATSNQNDHFTIDKKYVITGPDDVLYDKVSIPFKVAGSTKGLIIGYSTKKVGDAELFGDVIKLEYQ